MHCMSLYNYIAVYFHEKQVAPIVSDILVFNR